MRFVAIVGLLTACSGSRLEQPSLPRILFVDASPRDTLLPVGIPVMVRTSWAGECSRSKFPGMEGKLGRDHGACDVEDYDVEVRCAGHCSIRRAMTRAPAVEDLLRFHSGSGADDDTNTWFDVLPLADTLQIFVTMRSGSQIRSEQTPLLHVFVPDKVSITCTASTRATGANEDCDSEWSAADNINFTVRSGDERPLGMVKLNGWRTDRQMGMNLEYLIKGPRNDRLGPGDYTVVVELNPPPHTIRRELVIHKR